MPRSLQMPMPMRGAGKRDNSPEAIRKRREALAEAAAMLLPGDIRQVLAAGEGRLLVVPVRDTGTAPYAALPIRNQDDFAARRWSFVVMQDLNVLAGDSSGFDMGKVDLSKSVIVGDPDDMRDVRYSFPALPGARKEAQAIAKELGIADRNVLIGADATRKNVVNAIDRSAGQGVIYMATHAVADAETSTDPRLRRPQPEEPVCRRAANPAVQGMGRASAAGRDERLPDSAGSRLRGWNVRCRAHLDQCRRRPGRRQPLERERSARRYRLMTRFVAGLQQGKAPELAMQAAQLETIKNYPNDPKMWASFTIIGKPTIGSGPVQQRSGSSP